MARQTNRLREATKRGYEKERKKRQNKLKEKDFLNTSQKLDSNPNSKHELKEDEGQ
jgi:hypothetical protein